jgi:uncharacterized DUF497 family protein
MRDNEFEWDDRKAAANLARHRVSFEEARLAFDDPYAVEREDPRVRYSEARYILLGMAQDRLLHVTYTTRGERIRVISTRVPEPFERRSYHEGGS